MHAALAYLESLAIGTATAAPELSAELRDAIARRDQAALTALLGARHNLSCLVFPVDPDRQDDDKEKEPEDDEPKQQRAA